MNHQDKLTEIFCKVDDFCIEFDKEIDPKKLEEIADIKKVSTVSKNRYKIESEGQKDVRNQIFDFAVRNNLSVLTLQKEDVKLEDIFKQLTKEKIH